MQSPKHESRTLVILHSSMSVANTQIKIIDSPIVEQALLRNFCLVIYGTRVLTLASVGDVRVALVALVAVTCKASILLLAVAVLTPAKAFGHVPRALPRAAGTGRHREAFLYHPP